MMIKKYLALSLVVGALVIISGCGSAQVKNYSADQKKFSGRGLETGDGGSGFGMNFATGTVADLIEGKMVMVMGLSNADGSVSAKQIIVGDLSALGRGRVGASSTAFSSSSPNNLGGQPPVSDAGARFTGQGQRGNFGNRTGAGMRSGSGRAGAVRGEILKKDDTSLVIKLADGGSKIVFYSAQTVVRLVPPPPATSATTTAK